MSPLEHIWYEPINPLIEEFLRKLTFDLQQAKFNRVDTFGLFTKDTNPLCTNSKLEIDFSTNICFYTLSIYYI
jgi:hypothetical protein